MKTERESLARAIDARIARGHLRFGHDRRWKVTRNAATAYRAKLPDDLLTDFSSGNDRRFRSISTLPLWNKSIGGPDPYLS